MTSPACEHVIQSLRERFGDRFSTETATRDEHGHDVSHHKPHPPDAVVFPSCTNDVAETVRLCAVHRVPIIPFGTGTAVEGGVRTAPRTLTHLEFVIRSKCGMAKPRSIPGEPGVLFLASRGFRL